MDHRSRGCAGVLYKAVAGVTREAAFLSGAVARNGKVPANVYTIRVTSSLATCHRSVLAVCYQDVKFPLDTFPSRSSRGKRRQAVG